MYFFDSVQVINQEIKSPILSEKNIQLFVKREDAIHSDISGNKYRKLKYNLKAAKEEGFTKIITFGGAFSNHILATAVAGNLVGLQIVGVIRGEELGENIKKTLSLNPTLKKAYDNGMQFEFISRKDYREKMNSVFLEKLAKKHGAFYLLPEGGTNKLAVKGCEEILTEQDAEFDYICCCVGTGGTLAGIINSAKNHQKVLGFPALKGDFLREEISGFVENSAQWNLITDYHFGGYAKYTEELIRFINDFKRETSIPLDPIYTGKMMFGVFDMIKKNQFPESTKILAVHTGGLQGIEGFNEVLKKKKTGLKVVQMKQAKPFIFLFFLFFLIGCGSSKKVAKKEQSKTTNKELSPKKLPSVGQNKHVKKLGKKNTRLNNYTLAYIKKYAPIAVIEMHKYKIPASITLAQGILESGNGRSTLARKSNNHFGIKCHKGWNGGRVYYDDDEKGECFRKYKYAQSSYEDHSEFLTSRRRYADLFKLNLKNYKGWARGLKKAGYATDRKYPQKLIKIIQDYELYEFDKVRKTELKKEKRIVDNEKKNDATKVYKVKKGDTLYSIARRFGITVDKLQELNKLESTIISIGQELIIK